jgi:hypothetical protein
MFKCLRIGFIFLLIIFQYTNLHAQYSLQDTIKLQKQELFYDSLEYRANQRRLTEWMYDMLISPPRPYVDKEALALNYYNQYEGKIIADIKIQSLDVFGPSLNDTTKKAKSTGALIANSIHTKSNLKTIRKQLLFKIGDALSPEVMYENERIIRNLSYIKDTKFLVEQDSIYRGLVNITVLTKDRFSFGVSGGVNGTTSGDLKLYNRNIFGVGHEVSVRFVGHLNKEPYLGVETFYKIKNIDARFLDIELGYLNTYQREGFIFDLNKSFFTPTIKWGYGAYFARMLRTDRITNTDPVKVKDPLNLVFRSAWTGRGFNISPQKKDITQLVLSAGINNWRYFSESGDFEGNEKFFSNHTLYMAGLTISQRRYLQDQLVYSYGITEDIPEGFKNEIVYGYDANQFGDRHYLHFFTSNGNLLSSRSGYLYLSAGIGGYFKNGNFEEGQIQGNIDFISKIRTFGNKRVRTFINTSYKVGIRRYEIERLTLDKLDHIRGFNSDIAVGKQRLSLKLEEVFFLPKEYYKFNLALFGFADIGIIGSNQKLIFSESYYSGFGFGLRLHNENLVFETIRIRFAFYPLFPDDFHLFGFVLNEQGKKEFNSFEPTAPAPMRFE